MKIISDFWLVKDMAVTVQTAPGVDPEISAMGLTDLTLFFSRSGATKTFPLSTIALWVNSGIEYFPVCRFPIINESATVGGSFPSIRLSSRFASNTLWSSTGNGNVLLPELSNINSIFMSLVEATPVDLIVSILGSKEE